MLQVFYELTPNAYTEMQVVRYKGFQVGVSAATGQASTGKIPFDDPGGTLDIKGWRKIRVYETTASPTLLWSGRIRNKVVRRGDSERGSLRVGADRWWDCDAIDQNTLMGARIIRGTSANRPAESAGERLAWLLSTSFTIFVDNGHVTYPTDRLDPNDYTGQTAADVIADCATPGGYNFFALQVDDTDFPELFFMLQDDADWASSISISDVPGDHNGSTVFAPNYSAEIAISDEIVASGVFLPYSGSGTNAYVYVSDDDIGDEFAYVDKAAPLANVKTSAKASVIANRHLALSATEAEKITCTIHVPAALANALRPWHRVPYKSTWMPGFSAYRDCRVIDWSIEQQAFSGGGDGYLVHLELSPIETTPEISCSVALAAAESEENTGTESSPTATVTSTITDDGYVVALLLGCNGNTPNAENMGNPSGYTVIDNVADYSRSTWSLSYKAVSPGSATASASFTPGFSADGSWIAGQAWLPWAGVSIVQEKFDASAGATFDSPVTPGNTILMLAVNGSPGFALAATGSGWTTLYDVASSAGSGSIHAGLWARCVESGDGASYAWSGTAGGLQSNGTYIVEIAT
jgi:hypothetical protein